MSQQFSDLRAILEAAWDQPEPSRTDWLRQNCPDESLLQQALELLEADRKTGEFLELGYLEKVAGSLLNDLKSAGPERVVSQYRVIEPIARGGMGDVYLAERVGAPFEQRVALKLAHRAATTEDGRRRFLQEQQVLARLEHPNIARLIDGGIWEGDEWTPEGRPFLVMEYVQGEALDVFCQKNHVRLDERLRLMQSICEAVHYAHANLLVHRDLKPANILVTADRQVKLLDFGIASILAEERSAAETQTPLMTPEYAAPEQVLGNPITTATDVHALGLILYQLVSGQRTWSLDRATPAQIQQTVCERMPLPPSQCPGIESMPWKRRVKGDLDSIVLKALAKEPQRRYASARALAADLQNFMRRLPVEAQPDTWHYRLGKFIRRHPWESLATTMASLALVSATIVAVQSARQAREALSRATVEAGKSHQVVNFLRDLFASADPRQTNGEAVGIDEVLKRGSERIDEIAAQPEVQATLLTELGRIQTTLGQYEQAIDMLRQASELERSVQGPDSTAVADTLHHLSLALDEQGDLSASEDVAREALRIRQQQKPANLVELGRSLDRLGAVIAAQGRYEEAEPLIAEAVRVLTENAGENDERSLTALHNLAWLQGRMHQLEESERSYRKVIAIGERVHGPNHPELLVSRDSLAVNLRRQGKLDEAEAIYRDVLERRIQVLGENHQVVGVTQHNLGRLLNEKGEHEAAGKYLQDALDNWAVSLGPKHRNRGVGLTNLGNVQREMGLTQQAEASFREAIEILSSHQPDMNARLADAHLHLGRLLLSEERARDSLPEFQIALDLRTGLPSGPEELLEVRIELADAFLHLGQTGDARAVLSLIRHSDSGLSQEDEQAKSHTGDVLQERVQALEHRLAAMTASP